MADNNNAKSHRRAKNKHQKQREGNVEKPLPEPSSTIRSNLDSFLECTTPMVQCHFMPQASLMAENWERVAQSISFFRLGDLWDAFDEWSAYGAGVPLYLPTAQVAVQYYVPYLSALQIYARDSFDLYSTPRRYGDECDFSDVNSEASIDKGGTDVIWDASTQCSEDSDEAFHQNKSKRGQLLFEFFERISPYGRAPLAHKISELSRQFPRLRSFRSHELSPSSWVSVAWYPIYRIPMGSTRRDMGACFLTFHSLWTPRQGWLGEGGGGEVGSPPRVRRVGEEKIMLPAFGLAWHKVGGGGGGDDDAWACLLPHAERRRAFSLASCADAWLKQLRVHHPDFHFFASYGAPPLSRR